MDDIISVLEFHAVEEPLAPPGGYAAHGEIADAVQTRIVLDESLLRHDQIASRDGPARRWLVNMRVSKMGGLLRSLAVVDLAAAHGIHVIVGGGLAKPVCSHERR